MVSLLLTPPHPSHPSPTPLPPLSHWPPPSGMWRRHSNDTSITTLFHVSAVPEHGIFRHLIARAGGGCGAGWGGGCQGGIQADGASGRFLSRFSRRFGHKSDWGLLAGVDLFPRLTFDPFSLSFCFPHRGPVTCPPPPAPTGVKVLGDPSRPPLTPLPPSSHNKLSLEKKKNKQKKKKANAHLRRTR